MRSVLEFLEGILLVTFMALATALALYGILFWSRENVILLLACVLILEAGVSLTLRRLGKEETKDGE